MGNRQKQVGELSKLDCKKFAGEFEDLVQREQLGTLSKAEVKKWSGMAKKQGQSLPDYLNCMQNLMSLYAQPSPNFANMPRIQTTSERKKSEQAAGKIEESFRKLVGWAKSGELKSIENEKLKHAETNDGEGIPPIGRQVLEGYAASRGQTLPQYLRGLLEINGFIRKTAESEFDHELMTDEDLDYFARFPRFVLDVLGAGTVLSREGKLALMIIASQQEKEMRAQASGRGAWPIEAALEVAKVLIANWSAIIRTGESVFAEKEKLPPITSLFTRTHEEAGTLIQNTLIKSPEQRGLVARAFAWLRENKETPLSYPPWDASDRIHEGLEILKDALGLNGPSPVMSVKSSAPAASQPKLISSEEALLRGQPAPLAAVGKLAVIEWDKCLRYDGEVFNIQGVERWRDIRALLDARGEYVKLEKGFPQRFAQGGARCFRMIATEAEGPGRKGTGRYKIKQ